MVTTNDIVANILNFDEEEFFNADHSIMGPKEELLLDLEYFGVAVNAPPIIDIDTRDLLPLIMAVQFSGDRDWDISLKDNCILVGTNLVDGTVTFAKAFVSDKEMKSRGIREKTPKEPKPDGLATEAAQLTELDPKDCLSMEWAPGIWALGVIYYDWASNSVEVTLKGDEDIIPSSAGPVRPEPDPHGKGFLPCFLPTEQTLQLPEEGLRFSGELKIEDQKQILNFFGSFVLPARDFHLPAEKRVHQYTDGREENIAAVVPITLAILGLDWDEPLQYDWAVPVYGAPLAPGMKAKGFFSINALAEDDSLAPGKYMIYIVMDGKIFGPKALQIN